MNFGWSPSAADRRLLPEGRLAGPMPWVIAIMVFLTVLTAAAGLGLGSATEALQSDMAGRVTIQIVDADPDARGAAAERVLRTVDRLSSVHAARRVDEHEVAALLAPWLGSEAGGIDLPVPTLIDVDLDRTDGGALTALVRAVGEVAPKARIDAHARWMAPLAGLMGTLKLLAGGLVVLMAIATAAAVVLAARAALNTHRATIDVLHLLGGTDIQIARLFQRRIALDSLFGGLVGFLGGVFVLLLLAARLDAVGSDLLAAITFGPAAGLALLMVPIAAALLATVAARLTVVRALRRIL